MAAVLLTLCTLGLASGSPISFINGGYEGIVVKIAEDVPRENCRVLLNNLETALSSTSRWLHSALEGRAYLSEVSISLPDNWPDSCAHPSAVSPGDGQTGDVLVGRTHPVHKDEVWTQQHGGCGDQGDFVYVSENSLLVPQDLGIVLTREWAKFRYGVFDEIGYNSDPVYPQCYHGNRPTAQTTGCSDREITNICTPQGSTSEYNTTRLLHSQASRSILFAATPQTAKFCDEKTHDAFAPTKQNRICNRRSAMEVILKHKDFSDRYFNKYEGSDTNTTPIFHYTRGHTTRYVLVVENTKDMHMRESWSFLRSAVRKWTVHDLPASTEVGLVLVNDSYAHKVHDLTLLNGPNARDRIASDMPFTPGDSRPAACVSCGLRQAIEMLEDRKLNMGRASSVIVVVAPGVDRVSDLEDLLERARRNNIKVATINYPAVLRNVPLDALATATGGRAFTVSEQKYNQVSSLLTTYFELSNVLFSITNLYFQGNPGSLPIEIHRRELVDDGRTSMTGSFVLEESLGEPAEFVIYTHSIENPLLKTVQLVSPSQKIYSGRSDSLLQFKLMRIITNINETGTWSYTIERFTGNPQPHFVQVMASPKAPTAPVVRATLFTNQIADQGKPRYRREIASVDTSSPSPASELPDEPVRDTRELPEETGTTVDDVEVLAEGRSLDVTSHMQHLNYSKPAYRITVEDLRKSKIHARQPARPVALYVDVKRGLWPVLSARVEVIITKNSPNDTNRYRERFHLLDTGCGDPDVMKGDGIYSRYWSPVAGGPGSYAIDVSVVDNGNTAYSWTDGFIIPETGESCCGSEMKTPSVHVLSPFQRLLPRLTLSFTQQDIDDIQAAVVGRVLDLKVEHLTSELKARLTWTAPDMGGLDVARYSLHYSPSLETLLTSPLDTPLWSHGQPFPLAAGIETTFSLDFAVERSLLDQPLFFAILAYPFNHDSTAPGPLSNYVRVLMPSPPPPPPPAPTSAPGGSWFGGAAPEQTDEGGSVIPRIAQADFRLELILPVVGGIMLLMICLGIYCYFCVVRRKHREINKGKQSAKSSPEKNKPANINIISAPTALVDNRTHSTSSTTSSNTSHSTLQHDTQPTSQYTDQYASNDQYGYVDEQRRRYSAVQTPEEAYIIAQARNISQQNYPQQPQRPPSTMSGYHSPPGYVTQISNGTTGRIRTLSPYQSWTASQLLHEHERRTSPLDGHFENGRHVESGHFEGPYDTNRHMGPQFQLPPPVPPLPEESLYSEGGVRSSAAGYHPQYIRSPINPSLQGSLTSVNSSDVRKKRNVTMV